jgi:hypothetical protein
MSDYFTAEDLPVLNAAMHAFPHVRDGFRAMVDVGTRMSFPVESPEALQRVIAEVGPVRYGDSEIPLDDLPALMPAYYFPVDSVDDFFAKVSDVTARVREPDGVNMPGARLREAVAPRRGEEPTITDDEIRQRFDLTEIGAASIGGIRKRER